MDKDLFDELNERDPEFQDYIEEVSPEETTIEAPVEEEVEAEAETETETEAVEEPKRDEMVPLAALKAEREKAKAQRDEAEALRQQIAAMNAAKNSQTVPDPLEDPTAFYAHMREQMLADFKHEQQLEKLRKCEARAAQEHGNDYLQEVGNFYTDELARDPMIAARAMNSEDPVQYVIDLKKRRELTSQIEADPDEYVRRRAAELGLYATGEIVATEQATRTAKPTGPKSLAATPSRGVSKPTTKGLDGFFTAIE